MGSEEGWGIPWYVLHVSFFFSLLCFAFLFYILGLDFYAFDIYDAWEMSCYAIQCLV